MSRAARDLRAQRARKKLDTKRVRKAQRDQRNSEIRMTVVSAVIRPNDPASLAQVVQQTHAALLYADSVTLVSPVAALLKSARDLSKLNGLDLLFELEKVAPKYFPDTAADLRQFRETVDDLPPRGVWTSAQRREYDGLIEQLVNEMRPTHDTLQASVNSLMTGSGFNQLQLAIDAGLLIVESMPGVDVIDLADTAGELVGGLIERIDNALTSGRQYPLFDGETHEFIRGGVELGIFAPTPMARRLGKNAAMADGLFDRLPSFELATTSEILDIRTELAPSLGAFRQGVGSLAENIDVGPEDPQFGNEVEYAWNETVVPAINEIEETIQQNKSMKDLVKRIAKDPIGSGAITLAAAAPFSLAVAAGPIAQLTTATAMVFGLSLGTARGLIDENDEIRKAKKAQFYFLYGTNERLGIS
jgi:hypothetical protein